MRARSVFALLPALALFSGCGSDDDSSGAPSIPLSEIPKELADAGCAAFTDCFGSAADWLFGGEDCVTRLETQVGDGLPSIEDSLAAGRTRYAGDKVQACLDEVRAAGCEIASALESDACRAAIDGTVAVGGECEFDHECAGEAYCKSSGACPGTCTAREAVGAACDDNDHCAVGLACAEDTKRCYQPASAGDPCGGSDGKECAFGLFCAGQDEQSGKAGTCRTLSDVLVHAAGEACNPDAGELCSSGTSCVLDGVDGQTPKFACVAPATAAGPCKPGFPEHCPGGQYCMVPSGTIEGTCTELPGDGQPCAVPPFGTEPTLCAPYTRCESGNCRSLQHVGSSCQTDAVCYTEHCVAGKCAPGGACG